MILRIYGSYKEVLLRMASFPNQNSYHLLFFIWPIEVIQFSLPDQRTFSLMS